MKAIIPFILLIILSAAVLADSYGIERSEYTRKNQPSDLNAAVAEIKEMIEDGRDRFEIAKRATEIADNQITNNNDPERMNILSNWFPWADTSPQEVEFGKWRDKGGADKHYDEAANWAWENKYGQCAENSALVYYLLKSAGAKEVRIFGSSDHAFVVWGLEPEADPDDESNWNNDVIIPDSWQHYALSGKDAFNNGYCSKGSRVDITAEKDPSQEPRCGFITKPIRSPCCKTIEPCRGTEKSVCYEGYCSYCGAITMPCCEGDKCNFDSLECKNSKCVEKGEEEEELEELNEDYNPIECDTEIPAGSNWIDTSSGSFRKIGYTLTGTGWVGELQYYYDSDKTKLQSTTCYNEEGEKHGKEYTYYESGQVKKEVTYEHDELNGPFYIYYENGQTDAQGTYKEGKYDGEVKGWLEDGTLINEWNYVEGEKDGLQKTYHINGAPKSEVIMKMGKTTGNTKSWREDGVLSHAEEGSLTDDGFTGWMINNPGNGAIKCEYINGDYVKNSDGKSACEYVDTSEYDKK